ncbi:hypothetical protein [Streptomyces sp. NPDC093707]|uniref:hypothetical protein n=1 Tax=Streptomyces sp. NPDC093707 TaxID=3154984 RepID=UPI003450E656
MKTRTKKVAQRLAAAAGVLVTAGALQFAVAVEAQATPAQCINYISHNYTVGPKVKEACGYAHGTGIAGQANRFLCQSLLMKLNVRTEDADRACHLHE